MSGSGMIAAPVEPRRSAEQERADVLAYLSRRRANAETMAENACGFAEQGRDRARQIEIIESDIDQGLHEGAAELESDIIARIEAARSCD
jgi:hypothetical protein